MCPIFYTNFKERFYNEKAENDHSKNNLRGGAIGILNTADREI